MPADLVGNVLGAGNALKPEFAAKGVTLHRVTQPALSYTYFNMEDPVVGGYTPDKIALRRAMIMGFNTEEMIKVWWQGQALVGDAADSARGCGPQRRLRRARAVRPGGGEGAARQVRLRRPRQGRLARACRTASRSPW